MSKLASLILGALLLASPAEDTVWGADQSICVEGSAIVNYPNGQLQGCTLRDFYDAWGVRCNQYGPISFYENGTMKSCVTKDFYRYGGVISCNEYGAVSFYRSGRLQSCELAEYVQIYGNNCDQFQPIYLYENGRVKACGKPR